MAYTEDTLVQQTTANYLEQQLGWTSVFAYNNEVFGANPHPQPFSQREKGDDHRPLPLGEDSGEGADLAAGKVCLGRASDREVVLTRPLREKLIALNPGLPDAAYEDAVRQITAIVASQTLVATNREKYAQMRDGVQVTFRNDKGERVRERVRVFDFDVPENNDFLCVRELWVRGDLYRRRADIVGFVNGLPLLFIECKNIHKNLKTAFEQNFSDYRDTIPHLFHHNAIVMFGNGEKAKIGSITSRWEHFNEWKRLSEETPGTVDMEALLKGVCDKQNFLDLVENFILFDESAGEPKKIIARNHQFLGVNRAVAAVARRYAAIARPLTPSLSHGEKEVSGKEQAVHMRGGYDFAGLVQRARELRQAQTPAEEIFWELVRDRQFLGLKFRRQHQYGDYILDFYCHEAALAVEIDGGIHDTPEKKNKDIQRDGYLKSQGVNVVHVRNDTLLKDPEGTLTSLANTLPSPSGRGVGGEGKTPNDLSRLGVFWHTQGSGKSYSMVMFTRKVHRKLGGNFTFLVLTDRDDLDTQIYKTFANCGVISDQEPCRAASGQHLNALLTEHKAYVFSLIQKFKALGTPPSPPAPLPLGEGGQRPGEGYEAVVSLRDDIIVITDEAHRTQYGTLALNLRNALPNASYIGFTGTPLFKDDEITRRVFGEYVSTYDFQRAVDDKATVPLYYDARGEKLGVAIGDLNERIAEKLEEIEIGGIDVEQRLEKELKRDYHIITHVKRLDQIARDFVQHYSTAWETGKAMLVCIDKVTCVHMHKLIGIYWEERIRELVKTPAADEQDELFRQRQLAWMRETRMAVVVSEEQGEVARFNKWDLDITPHRKLMKDGIDLPESMRAKPEYRNMQTMALDDAFKAGEHPLRVAIVCAMWLTGFDVPTLSTLYLDKPLKAHTLMQAIARANRVAEGKNNGLIVDYCGILKHLRQALATFAGVRPDGEGSETNPARPDEELLVDLAEAITLVRAFLDDRHAALDDVILKIGFARNAAIIACKEAANENDESRKRFEVMCREVFKKFKACINVQGVNACRADRDAINIVYKSLQQDREQADITDIIRQLHQVVDEAIAVRSDHASETSPPYDISKIDFDRLRQEFERSPKKNTTVQNLREAVEQRLQRLLLQNPLRTDFQQHYENIVTEYNREKDRVTIEKTFEALFNLVQELDDEAHRAVREGLDEESLAIFDLLKKPDLKPAEIRRIKAVATQLLARLKEEKLRVDQWRDKEATRDAVRQAIHDFLYSDDTGLPMDCFAERDVKVKAEDVFRHIYRAYPTLPSPYFSAHPGL